MPVYKAPIRDFQFVLNDYLNLAQYQNVPGFSQENLAMMPPVLEAAAQLCEEVLFPLNQKGDKIGLKYEKAASSCPTVSRKPIRLMLRAAGRASPAMRLTAARDCLTYLTCR